MNMRGKRNKQLSEVGSELGEWARPQAETGSHFDVWDKVLYVDINQRPNTTFKNPRVGEAVGRDDVGT